jgi:hypothetical protein
MPDDRDRLTVMDKVNIAAGVASLIVLVWLCVPQVREKSREIHYRVLEAWRSRRMREAEIHQMAFETYLIRDAMESPGALADKLNVAG